MKIARLVVTDGFSFSPKKAGEAILNFLNKLEGKVDWITASGCFLGGKFPVAGDAIATGWKSKKEDQAEVHGYGDPLVEEMMTPEVSKALKSKAKYFSFGIDLKERDGDKLEKHVELVFVWDCQNKQILQRTGKTYPCGSGSHDQTHTLFHTTSYETHFVEACGERVLVIGCNDLNMFNPRALDIMENSRKVSGIDTERYTRTVSFRKAVKKFNPTVVLQHPHFSDTPNIWYMKWTAGIQKLVAPKAFCSAICYGRWPDKKVKEPQPIRGTQEDVLSKSLGGCLPGKNKLGTPAWPIQDVLVSHLELKKAA